VQGIQGDKGALGYIPFAYYTENTTKVKALAVDWEKDEEGAIDPTLENVLAAKYNPLSRPLFLYVNRKSAERPEVRAFVEYYLVRATELVQEVKYMPLTSADYALVLERFRANKTGSAFDGKPEVGVALSEVLKREPK
jgi:phosphate transport system substrate-binding protein